MSGAKTAFDVWFDKAVEYEGKINEDVPGDGGGPTRWGITIGRLATIKGVKEPKRGTAAFEKLKAELFALSEDEIKAIYKRDYWDAVRGDDLPAGVNFAGADWGLNSGPSRAVRYFQKLCGNPQSGTMDDETIREVNAYNAVELILLYQEERAKFLNGIVASRPNQRKFLKGWLSRVGDVRRAAIAMAEKDAAGTKPAAPAPMPKAIPAEADKPASPVQEAMRSKSIGAIFSVALAKILDWFFGVADWVGDRLGDLSEVATGASKETSDLLSPLATLAESLKLNLGAITTWLTVAILVVVAFRVIGNKTEIANLKKGGAP